MASALKLAVALTLAQAGVFILVVSIQESLSDDVIGGWSLWLPLLVGAPGSVLGPLLRHVSGFGGGAPGVLAVMVNVAFWFGACIAIRGISSGGPERDYP